MTKPPDQEGPALDERLSSIMKIDSLQTALKLARQKLVLYRQRVGREYVGGADYTILIRKIDEALK
jgi:hypothetical protein